MAPKSPAQLFTLAQAGEQLGVAPSTLRHQAATGRLDAWLLGKTWVVNQDAIDRYRAEHLGQPGRRAKA